jgi:hypothetical protein
MRNSYFWSPPGIASSRGWYEGVNSSQYEFVLNDKKIELECNTECSCKHIYYRGNFTIDDRSVTIRSVKKLLEEVKNQIIP